MVERLSESCRLRGRELQDALDAIQAFDLLPRNVEASRRVAEKALIDDGWQAEDAASMAEHWVCQADYLLRDRDNERADFVLGNPPYIRLEDVPAERMAAYRAACPTMTGRSDIYVGFYEVALRSLKPGGVVGFICADRWMRNQYGDALRRLIGNHYSVDATIIMHDVDAFHEQVAAYPAISIIRHCRQGEALVVDANRGFGPEDSEALASWVRDRSRSLSVDEHYELALLPHWFDGNDSWPTGAPSRLALLEDLNDRFPRLEESAAGTRVGIGVATGADGVFITNEKHGIEEDRLLPLALVRDTTTGTLDWSGHYLVDPWTPEGQLVDLERSPGLSAYLQSHSNVLRKRYVATKNPAHWYKTIDKVDHSLTSRAKLLFPDMKLAIHPVLEPGELYPHHNLYYVISDGWDLRVLGGLLLSKVAELFVEAYAVRMRGGTLRFQAQYLRRIRVPNPGEISVQDQVALARAFDERDRQGATTAALRAYGIAGELATSLLS